MKKYSPKGGFNMDRTLMNRLDDLRVKYRIRQPERPLEIREVSNQEIRFYFNPDKYDHRDIDVRPLMMHASLWAGVREVNLKHAIDRGEIVVYFNPIVTDENSREFVKRIMTEYFDKLPVI